jgi:hypothetical protein
VLVKKITRIRTLISNTKAYLTLKEQNQTLFDFSVLSCYSVPALKGYMKAVENNAVPKIPDADHFKGSPDFTQLRNYATSYKKTLGRLVFISSFSYFESYFKALIEEVLSFHGGHDRFLETALKRQSAHLAACDLPTVAKPASKLREYKKKHVVQGYQKHIKALEATDFRFPSELFATFGLMELINYKDLKASQIPHVAKWCFGVPITPNEEVKFSKYRDDRNDIAHGDLIEVDFSVALKASGFLRDLSLKIDKHVVKHFFVIENV